MKCEDEIRAILAKPSGSVSYDIALIFQAIRKKYDLVLKKQEKT